MLLWIDDTCKAGYGLQVLWGMHNLISRVLSVRPYTVKASSARTTEGFSVKFVYCITDAN